MKKRFNEYRFEISSLLIVLVGIFLLVEPFSVRTWLRAKLLTLASRLHWWSEALTEKIIQFLTSMTLSDLIGGVIVLLATIFFLTRVRHRYLNSSRWLSTTCPVCGKGLHRRRRNRLDHFLGKTILPNSRRYFCSECGWSGLSNHIPRLQRPAREAETGQEALFQLKN